MLSKYLTETYKLAPQRHLITCLDQYKLYCRMAEYQKRLIEFGRTNEAQLTHREKYVIMMETHPLREVMYLLSQTHFTHYFTEIYFLISNPRLSEVFESLYQQRHQLADIADEMISIFDRVFNQPYLLEVQDRKYKLNLSVFYSWTMITKLIQSFDFANIDCREDSPSLSVVQESATKEDSPVTKEDSPSLSVVQESIAKEDSKLNEYIEEYFMPACLKVQDYLLVLEKSKDRFEGQIGGLSQFPAEVYQYIAKYYLGVEVTNQKLVEWEKVAELQLKMLTREVCRVGKKLFKVDGDYESYLKLFQSATSQKWANAQEMVDAHREAMEKYYKMFMETLGFNHFMKLPPSHLHIFDNPRLAGGYHYMDTFFLNKCDWESNRKFDVRSLVLHETVPGHHLQKQINVKLHPADILPNLYQLTTGFVEGWGLFAESLYSHDPADPDNHLWNRYGELQMDILRTLRIVIDIGFHIHGRTVEAQIQTMTKYLSCGAQSIEAEAYRYQAFPGQALCYKIGQIAVKNLFKGNDLHDADHLVKYKELLSIPEMPLFMYDTSLASHLTETVSVGNASISTNALLNELDRNATVGQLDRNLYVETGDGFISPAT